MKSIAKLKLVARKKMLEGAGERELLQELQMRQPPPQEWGDAHAHVIYLRRRIRGTNQPQEPEEPAAAEPVIPQPEPVRRGRVSGRCEWLDNIVSDIGIAVVFCITAIASLPNLLRRYLQRQPQESGKPAAPKFRHDRLSGIEWVMCATILTYIAVVCAYFIYR